MFKFLELVESSSQFAGVILGEEGRNFRVLWMNGEVDVVDPREIRAGAHHRYTYALDSNHKTIQPGNKVVVVNGPHWTRVGLIKYLYSSFAFIDSDEYQHTEGIFVCETSNLELADDTADYMNEDSSQGSDDSRSLSSSLIGRTVLVTRGTHMGKKGVITDATSWSAKVKLDDSSDIILVDRSCLWIFGIRMNIEGRTVQVTREDHRGKVGVVIGSKELFVEVRLLYTSQILWVHRDHVTIFGVSVGCDSYSQEPMRYRASTSTQGLQQRHSNNSRTPAQQEVTTATYKAYNSVPDDDPDTPLSPRRSSSGISSPEKPPTPNVWLDIPSSPTIPPTPDVKLDFW